MKTATQIIEEVREDMCNFYCKHSEVINSAKDDSEYDELSSKYCWNCPLNRL